VFDGVTHLDVRGCLVPGDRVSDIEVVEDGSRPLNLTEMLLVAPAAKIRILLAGSGSMVLVEYRAGQLKNLDRNRALGGMADVPEPDRG
jgi:hypothetical protein